jgi:hypothetical protein
MIINGNRGYWENAGITEVRALTGPAWSVFFETDFY